MKYICFLSAAVMLFCAGCTTMLPVGDIRIAEYCKEEIAVLKNPKLTSNSKEKYEAAISLSKKVDFSYTRNIHMLKDIFLDSDARVNRIDADNMVIIMYYDYEDDFISFEFHRYQDHIVKTIVRYQ